MVLGRNVSMKGDSGGRRKIQYRHDQKLRGLTACGGRPRRAAPKIRPYTPDQYSSVQTVFFTTPKSWEDRQSKLLSETKRLAFNESFDVTDAHIDAMLSMGPAFCQSLRDFRAGDAETGKGANLSDAVIDRLARACPNLVHVGLDGATQLTDMSLLSLFTNCKNLRYVQVSGNDKVAGRLRGTALDLLRDNPTMGARVVKLRFTDQSDFDKVFKTAVKTLSLARKRLAIEVGNTHERHGGVHTWLGGKERHGYQAFGGPGDFDSFGGYSRVC